MCDAYQAQIELANKKMGEYMHEPYGAGVVLTPKLQNVAVEMVENGFIISQHGSYLDSKRWVYTTPNEVGLKVSQILQEAQQASTVK